MKNSAMVTVWKLVNTTDEAYRDLMGLLFDVTAKIGYYPYCREFTFHIGHVFNTKSPCARIEETETNLTIETKDKVSYTFERFGEIDIYEFRGYMAWFGSVDAFGNYYFRFSGINIMISELDSKGVQSPNHTVTVSNGESEKIFQDCDFMTIMTIFEHVFQEKTINVNI